MYDYFTKTRKLDNLLWVYGPNVSFGGAGTKKTDFYYPGSEYVDIVALDWYTNTVDNLNADESYDRLVALGKPFGISEFGPEKQTRDGSFDNLLIVKALTEGPWRAGFFIYWDSWGTKPDRYSHVAIMDNSNAKELMTHPKVINRDKVAWK
jgi:mannan endo-1,4-beta-mannosidase